MVPTAAFGVYILETPQMPLLVLGQTFVDKGGMK